MARNRRSFRRPKPKLAYRKLFVIATEGEKTEPAYFELFNSKETTVWIKVLPSRRQTSPQQVLERTLDYVKEKNLKKKDEIWLVIDRDEWSTAQLEDVFSKCQPLDFHLAVSNPKFEYWLLLHFEDGKGIKSPKSCSKKLLQHLPNYKKRHLEVHKLYPRISDAIRRAKEKDQPPCKGKGSAAM